MDFSLSETQLALQKLVKDFTEKEIESVAVKLDNDGRLPDGLIKKLAGLGLLGMTLPEKYGGASTDNLSCILTCEQLAYTGTAAWWLIAFNNSIPEAIYHFGTEKQKQKYLPAFCNGAAYASIQFTEDETGSDPAALKTTVKRTGNYYLLNGSKRFSTFGARPGYAIVFARDDNRKCNAFVLNKNVKGYTVSKNWELMGSGGIEAVDVTFEDVRVPAADLLGKPDKGFEILLYWVAIEKIQQSAAAVGIGQAALDEAIIYARSRQVKGKPISEMQGIRWMLAEMEVKIKAARCLTYRAAFLQDKQSDDWITEAAATKLFVVPAMIEVVETARRVHGAYGYAKELKIERLHRAIAGASGIATSLEINKSIVASRLLADVSGG